MGGATTAAAPVPIAGVLGNTGLVITAGAGQGGGVVAAGNAGLGNKPDSGFRTVVRAFGRKIRCPDGSIAGTRNGAQPANKTAAMIAPETRPFVVRRDWSMSSNAGCESGGPVATRQAGHSAFQRVQQNCTTRFGNMRRFFNH